MIAGNIIIAWSIVFVAVLFKSDIKITDKKTAIKICALWLAGCIVALIIFQIFHAAFDLLRFSSHSKHIGDITKRG